MFKSIRNAVGRQYVQRICRREFENQRLSPNERPIEYRFLFEQIVEIRPQSVLDVGTGITAVPALVANCGITVTAIDNIRDFWPKGMFNRHFHVIDEDIIKFTPQNPFDLVTCISVLEHIRDQDAAVDSMFRALKPGGHLVITGPYSDPRPSPNVYALADSDAYGKTIPFICQAYCRATLDKWLARHGATIVRQEFWQFYEGEFWSCGTPVIPPRRVDAQSRHQITCLLLRKAG